MIRFTEEEYNKFVGKPQDKYRNKKVEFDGIKFDSERERDRYAELKLLAKAGEITDLKLQPVFELIPAIRENGKTVQTAIKYRADFSYKKDGKLVVEDAKGVKTEVYKLKKKLMRYLLNIEIIEI